MTYLLLNIFFAGAWVLINSAYTAADFAVGFLLGFGALWLIRPFGLGYSYFRRFRAAAVLLVFFFRELTVSVLRVAWDVLTPGHRSDPDIVLVPLDASSDLEITLLANMVSLTPGTLSLDITPGRTHLVVHAMFAEDHDTVIRSIKDGLERLLLEVTRD